MWQHLESPITLRFKASRGDPVYEWPPLRASDLHLSSRIPVLSIDRKGRGALSQSLPALVLISPPRALLPPTGKSRQTNPGITKPVKIEMRITMGAKIELRVAGSNLPSCLDNAHDENNDKVRARGKRIAR